ncbi:MAG: DUF547 domain-containing protein [Winogradskyella sp.]|nr:DUF547 domain-containing protein [Winogradskyella sp.]
MKYIFVLIVSFITMSSCSGAKNLIKTPQKAIDTDMVVVTDTPTNSKTSTVSGSHTEDNSTQISLGDDGTISNEGMTVTTEIIYNEAFDHALFNDLLQKHVSNAGNVNYIGFKNDSNTLQRYIELLKTYQPSDSWTKNDKLAYWINAYNALTIDLVIRNYPLKSIKDIKDPWDQRLWQFGEKWLNLNAIEHEILRKMDEPRIHFAIVCASISCPKLENEAFTAAKLEDQLTNATMVFLMDKSKNELSEDTIKISKIFKWFKSDFEQGGSLIDFLNEYSDITISEKAKKSFTDYNWDLNN